jgi:hypothetical protein
MSFFCLYQCLLRTMGLELRFGFVYSTERANNVLLHSSIVLVV